ncbi:pyridoxal phosphate-dependent transferase [Cladochytrium replicatum]|nr:pyridoxal phosphate-dependent transferase [Cladochytrium replicatum]
MSNSSEETLVAAIRSRFPGIIDGEKESFAYMDNAGGSQVLTTVADRVREYLLKTNVQLGATYKTSKVSTHLTHLGVIAGQKFVNAADISEIVLGGSTTQLVENLARAMEPRIPAGAEFIISESDHEANIGPIVRLAKRLGLTLKVWKVDRETLELDPEELERLMNENTRLVCVTHCSNILGTINDVKRFSEIVHRYPGAEICVDGVALAPHRYVDVQELGVDYYVFSWYKVYGPHISQLYVRQKCYERLSSIAHFFIPEDEHPYSLQPGGANYELAASLPVILEYFRDLSQGLTSSAVTGTPTNADVKKAYNDVIAPHEERLAQTVVSYLLSKPEWYEIVGRKEWSSDRRVPTVSFYIVKGAGAVHTGERKAKTVKSEDLVLKVDSTERYGIRWGHFYAYRLVNQALNLGDDGIIRVSLVHYNTVEEVEGLVKVLDSILSNL